MRIEINVILFFPDKPMKEIKGFLSVPETADEDCIMDSMGYFVEDITQEYMEDFSSGVANMVVGDDELFHISFANPQKEDDKRLCNIIFPDEMTVH
tara:strand:- start:2073 stop:2360 length:288 start_codon:yes stop_codon:yes gene_type:complete